jgi:hypothetical protein
MVGGLTHPTHAPRSFTALEEFFPGEIFLTAEQVAQLYNIARGA